MQSWDIENDYSLCYDEQYSIEKRSTNQNCSLINDNHVKNTQNSSILTSICLDNDPLPTTETTKVVSNKSNFHYDSTLLNSEYFFQEKDDELTNDDYNFTKLNEIPDDVVIEKNLASEKFKIGSYDRSISIQTLEETSNRAISKSEDSKNGNLEANGTEAVKHKLTNLWNNVKYGWVSYLKKPNRITLENGPIFILGKKFDSHSNNQYNRVVSDPTNNSSSYGSSKPSESILYDYIDANKLGSLNESYIYPSIQSTRSTDEYSNIASSPPLSTSPFSFPDKSLNSFKQQKADYCIVDEPSTSSNTSYLKSKFTMPELYQLQYLNLQKTSVEQEIHSRLWFTYRKDFAALNGNLKYTSDCGWGCMLRSAQMLIGQGLLMHHFNKEWSLYNKFKPNQYSLYKEIVSLFNDRPSQSCPFGIHRLLEIADKKLIGNPNPDNSHHTSTNNNNNINQNKKSASNENVSRAGSWFGPTSVCLLMKEALNEAVSNPLLSNIKIYVAQDCTIYKQDIIDMCMENSKDVFKPCIILISVRLGGEDLNEIYIPSLKAFLEMDTCIGLIGGKPKHSLYFIGYQEDKVIYLDPHFCQPTTNIYSSNDQSILTISSQSSLSSSSKHSYDDPTSLDFEVFDNSTFHCENPNKTPFLKLDPSLAIGFLCSSLAELNNLCDKIKEISSSEKIFPIFGINDDGFENSQQKFQVLCEDEALVDSISDQHSSQLNKKASSPPMPIITKSKTPTNISKSRSHGSSKSLSNLINSFPMKFDKLRFEKFDNDKEHSSQKKSLAEKFTRSKQQSKKKSESDDFFWV